MQSVLELHENLMVLERAAYARLFDGLPHTERNQQLYA
jgi:hypothetical protein